MQAHRTADVCMFWRMASILQAQIRAGDRSSAMQEGIDEIESIRRHTQDAKLRSRCEALLTQVSLYGETRLTDEPFYSDLNFTGCSS